MTKALKKKAPEPLTDEAAAGLDAKIVNLKNYRQEAKALAEDIATLQKEVLEALERHGLQERVVREGRKVIAKGAWAQNVPEVLNEPKLAKRLGSKVWNSISRRRLDKDLLAQALKEGRVKANDVAACSDPKPSAPFVRTT